KIVQIAGTLARRIVPYVKKGEDIKKGDRIGIIRLGSRVDIYLPKNKIKKINVEVGDKIKAGEDTIAEINA
ncbi:MAG: phosphatidylserine decarboxylase, partial [Psychroflexus sp.]